MVAHRKETKFLHSPHPWRGVRPWTRHGLVLMVAGLVYIGVGVSYLFAEMTPTRALSLHYAFQWAPPEFWGGIFVFAGALSILSSRWPPVSETWGYTVLTGLSVGWAGFYFIGIWPGQAPVSNLTGVMSWGLIGFLWWAISGLVNPPPAGGRVVISDHGG